MEMTRYYEGVPSWVDLGSPDLDASRRFYSELLGWTIEAGGPEVGGYGSGKVRGKQVAGVGPLMDPNAPPAWTTYVNSADANEIATKVAAAEGKVLVEPMDVMDFGRLAVFADPAGAVIATWQPNQHRGAELVNEPGAVVWNELMTTDTDGAKAFYQAVFGWESKTETMGNHEYTEFAIGGRSIAGMLAKPEGVPAEVPSHWSVYFGVDDAAAAVAKAESLGAKVMVPPTEIPFGTFASLVDNVGAPVSICQLKS